MLPTGLQILCKEFLKTGGDLELSKAKSSLFYSFTVERNKEYSNYHLRNTRFKYDLDREYYKRKLLAGSKSY